MCEAFPQPCEISAVALGKFGVAIGRASQPSVAADDVQCEKRDTPEIPADVFAVFGEFWIRALTLTRERNGTLAKALFACKEQGAQFCQPLERLETGGACLVMAIGPLVVARKIDQRIDRRAELFEPAGPERVRS